MYENKMVHEYCKTRREVITLQERIVFITTITAMITIATIVIVVIVLEKKVAQITAVQNKTLQKSEQRAVSEREK